MIRVLIAAESAVLRAGMESLISPDAAIAVAGTAQAGGLAARIEELQPEVVVLESSGESADRLEALIRLGPPFVLLTRDNDASLAVVCLRAGAGGVLPNDASPAEITAAIHAVANGLTVLHPRIMSLLQLDVSSGTQAPPDVHGRTLTPREIQVLGMLAEGLGNKMIAFRLGISEHTVKFHLASIFTKLNASSRAEAVALGIRQGWILL